MKVSSDSWHYKILMTEHQQKVRYGMSLCVYFWMVALAMFVWTTASMVAVGLAAALVMVGYLSMYVWYFLIAETFFGIQSFDSEAIFTSLVVNGFLVATWVLVMVRRVQLKYENKKIPENLVVSYIKAKKQKVCPMIEFEERGHNA